MKICRVVCGEAVEKRRREREERESGREGCWKVSEMSLTSSSKGAEERVRGEDGVDGEREEGVEESEEEGVGKEGEVLSKKYINKRERCSPNCLNTHGSAKPTTNTPIESTT